MYNTENVFWFSVLFLIIISFIGRLTNDDLVDLKPKQIFRIVEHILLSGANWFIISPLYNAIYSKVVWWYSFKRDS